VHVVRAALEEGWWLILRLPGLRISLENDALGNKDAKAAFGIRCFPADNGNGLRQRWMNPREFPSFAARLQSRRVEP
jgi:hypothetical protein